MTTKEQRAIEAFNRDANEHTGYRYSTAPSLSSRLANGRISDAVFAAADFAGKRVLDIGCGDGSSTLELRTRGRAAEVVAIDPAAGAVQLARDHGERSGITFEVASAYQLPFPDDSFDVALFRGSLHHMDCPTEALREALRVARGIVLFEPNGYNPVVKLLENLSRYHIEHGEKSYAPHRVARWLEASGARVTRRRYAGLVPCFCPNWMARSLKAVEPAVERTPALNALTCAGYCITALRDTDLAPVVASDTARKGETN